MKWISVKERLPPSGEIVLIKLKYSQPFMCLARYLFTFLTAKGEYTHIFNMMVHPRFPKEWLFDNRYRKISRIPKNKVECWMAIPGLTNEEEQTL